MEQRTSLAEIIEYIDPGSLSYQDWVNVGMALKLEGYPISVWDQWSQKDFSRYHSGECERKWRTFSGASSPVTGGTIVQMAIEHGWVPERGHELDWNDSIQIDSDRVVVDKNWLEGKEIQEPENWNPAEQLITYLETLFEAGENVGYVTGSWEKTDEKGTRWLPQKGSWDRTAGQLIEQLNSCNGDIGAVLGDYNPEAGAWIRFNPLDGNGCKNENVTEYRYALVESDHMDIEQQNAILRELELPIACLVYSGKKSLHAIVRVDAADYSEYRKRVDYLYEVCQKNGIDVDTQNRNPSRLSRMPGVQRGEKKQFIVDTNLGKASWNEWYEWIEGVNDDLPEPEGLECVWDNLPELSPCLIEGILRKGHKMLIAGPSKAGKDGKWYCIREYYYSGRDNGKQKTDSEYADDLKEWLDGTKIRAMIVDPSAASFIAELRKRGIKVLKANNDVLDGIRLVGMLLNLEKLVFASSCVETIKEFASYIWDEKAADRGEDKPIKQHDHSMDAVRYFCSTVIGSNTARFREVRR